MSVMKTWSIPLGGFLGAHVRLHLSFFALLGYLVLEALDKGSAAEAGGAAMFCALIAVAVFVHELGHLLACRMRETDPRIVILLPIGGVALKDETAHRRPTWFADELIVSLAGPLTSFVFALIIAGAIYVMNPQVNLLARPPLTGQHPGLALVWISAVLGIINLFPFYPLDGGRVLRAVLAHNEDAQPDMTAATRRVVAISQVFVFFLFIVGMLKGITWLMLMAFFLFVAVQMEDRNLIFQMVTENVRLEEIMLTSFSTLSPADTLSDALQKAVHSLQDDFPVIRGVDMVGVISKQNIIQALREDGNGYVQSAMKKVSHIAGRNETLAAAFKKITASKASIIPVVDDNRLVGIVTLQNLMHSMGLLAEQKRLEREVEE